MKRGYVITSLYLMEKLHQTTTGMTASLYKISCILWKNYIKPQLHSQEGLNVGGCILWKNYIKPQLITQNNNTHASCILWKNYIKPQPIAGRIRVAACCILWKNYIKPQRCILHSILGCGLYLMEKLHQTTTFAP